jgi:hypothetical protein
MLLGVIGFAQHALVYNLPNTFWDDLYLTFQLIPMNSGGVQSPLPWMLEVARFAIPLLTAAAAVKAVLALFARQIQMLRLRGLSGHVVICGLSRKGFLLAEQFRRQDTPVVVIERDENNDWVESCREQGMYVLLGDASDPTLLNTAGVARAKGLFAVCDHDGANAEIALRAQQLTPNRSGEPLICLLHVSDPQLCNLLREQEASLEQVPFQLELFNIFERAARNMLQEYPAWNETQIDQEIPPHILIVGLGRLGENLLLHVARDWSAQRRRPTARLRVTIVDRHANSKTDSLCIRYPKMTHACELRAIQVEIQSPLFECADFLFNAHHQPDLNAIYICVDNDAIGLQAGLTLTRRIPDANTPIVVRMAEETGLAKLLEFRKNHRNSYRHLFAFGYLNRTCTPDLLKNTPRDRLARLNHEEYTQREIQKGISPLNRPSMQPWESLESQFRQTNYNYVDHIQRMLEAAGYRIVPLSDWDAPAQRFPEEIVLQMAKMEHALWVQDLLAQGWRFAAGPKDPVARTHPDLVDWDDLSEDEREKNLAMINSIPAFLGRVGLQSLPTDPLRPG